MFGLGSEGAPSDLKERHMELGKEIARTCRESYRASGKNTFQIIKKCNHVKVPHSLKVFENWY